MPRKSALKPFRRRGGSVSAFGRRQTRPRTRYRTGGAARRRVVRVRGGLQMRLRAGVRQQHNSRGAAATAEGLRCGRRRRCRVSRERGSEPLCYRRERYRPMSDGASSITTTGRRGHQTKSMRKGALRSSALCA